MTSVGDRQAAAALAAPTRISGTVWAALAVVYVVWGSTYLAIRVVVESMPALLSGAIRFLLAGALLLGWVVVRNGPAAVRVTWRQLASAGTVGVLLLVGGNGLLVIAEGTVPSGLAALLVAVVPLWVVLLRAVSGERQGLARVGGVLLGLVGLAVLSLPGLFNGSGAGSIGLGGVVLVMIGALSWAVGSFVGTKLPRIENAMAASAYQMLIGGLGCLVVALARREQQHFHLTEVTTRSWLALLYLVLVGSLVGFTAYSWLLQNAPLGLVATYAYVNPVVAVFLGWLVLAERLATSELVGGLIVVAAVCVVVSTERRARAR
ncbi:EamA family transporter [Kitasatospora viridis]|uniref:Threonine/homoserine efflux transporter RhtA n=1 Tax=Kitasatospora viridis TaxID=281105 RepID=A0A561UBM4_9ACTN|nr:EamA family transporter [Kitasatospora viridis]TWF96755.1 threonine/homoserine efflux transporter RhtA [Kitasatospora viridis]